MRKCSFLILELALLLALAVTLLWGAWSLHRQDDLQEKMIRLHVIANSDSDADQTLKLCVRDAVLCRAEEILRQSADMTEARARLRDSLPAIGDAAAQELAGQRLFCLRRAGGYGVSPQDLRRLCPARRGVSGAPGGHRRGGGTQLVVCGVSAFVYRCRLRAGGCGAGGRHDGGRPVSHDRRERRVCAALPLAGAVGAPAAVAGQINDDSE